MTIELELMALVDRPLRELFWMADQAVEVAAWVRPESLAWAKLLGEIGKLSRASFAIDGDTYTIDKDGAAASDSDLVFLGGFVVRGAGLGVLRHFLVENEKAVLDLQLKVQDLQDYFPSKPPLIEDYELTLAFEDHGGHLTKVRYLSSGGVLVHEMWGSAEHWDAWVVSRGGLVEYVGTVYGTRRLPPWLERAIEEANARTAWLKR